ncbi:beta-glucosidase [Dichotomopilus funicola]|uniref:Beta-glucosidase cel3A n=1 Tax=Dichotomopilus funicola TaxID=1934379 RepID=A0AAN6V1B1_9PEZI|nr:beta-glucosidase [Dichotomopilus funicola]
MWRPTHHHPAITWLLLLLLSTPLIHAVNTDVPFPGYPAPWAVGVGSENAAADPAWAEAYAQAIEFVSNLTLIEKVNLTTGTGWEADRCIGNTGGVPRLGFRGFCLEDGPLGVRYTQNNSAFPPGINVAATFSRRLMRLRGEALGEEFGGKGIDIMLGPAAGPLGRVPQGGRDWEGFGPDPYLAGVAFGETIQGIQSRGVIACAKHYILNEQEHYRGSIDVRIDDRTMHELYLWPFADAVRAGVGSVMCSYNKINGTYACENEWTTNYLLKNELAFQGFVMSDWNAQHTTLGSALAGLDMAMPGDKGPDPYQSLWGGGLTEAVLRGDIPQWRLDDMVVRIMAAYFKVHTGDYADYRPDINFSAWTNETEGYLHPSSNHTRTVVNEFVDVQADGKHAELIREIGAKSVVLLKNNETTAVLPLSKPASIALIGDDAHDQPGGPNACVDRGCFQGTIAMGYGSGTADFPYLISPATALRRQAEADNTTFTTTPPPDGITTGNNWDLETAQKTAAGADVAIVFAAATAGEDIFSIDGNAGDRNNLTLWGNGDALIAAVAAVNPRTVVVLHTPGPVLIGDILHNPNVSAILWAGFPGQESGNSLVDVLYGRVNPQGRSPFTWADKSVDEYGAQLLFDAPDPKHPSQSFDEGVFIDYRWFQHSATGYYTVPFGFGLSYTSFRYSNFTVTLNEDVSGILDPAKGQTAPAPEYGDIDLDDDPEHRAQYVAPDDFERVLPFYVYSWLNNSETLVAGSPGNISDFPEAARDGSPQPVLPASGAQGGHPGLYDVLYTLTAYIENQGNVTGTEIPQVYVQLGGHENPWGVLRGFEEVELAPGETKEVTFNLTRRDVSNWNTTTQAWEFTTREKVVFVGSNVRDIHLNSSLPAPKGITYTYP